MLFPDPTTLTAADLAAPGLDAEALGQVATYRPDLRHVVAAHPNASQELIAWIAAQPNTPAAPAAPVSPAAPPAPEAQDPAAPAAPAAPAWGAPPAELAQPAQPAAWGTPPAPPAEPAQPAQPAAWGEQPAQPSQPAQPTAWGTPPTAQQPGQPGQPGYPGQPTQPQPGQPGDENGFDKAVQQGAEAAQAFGRDFAARTQEIAGQKDWKAWLPLAVPVFALLGFISLLLPFASVKVSFLGRSASQSVNGFQMINGFVATLMALVLLALAAFGAYVFATRKAQLGKLLSIIGMVAGALGILLSILAFASVGDAAGKMGGFGSASAGFGLILFLICSIVIAAVSVMAFINVRKQNA